MRQRLTRHAFWVALFVAAAFAAAVVWRIV